MKDNWPLYKRFFFLFFATYVFLYTNSTQFVTAFVLMPIWEQLVPVFSKIVGGPLEIQNAASGSGDTTFNYYFVLLTFCLSVLLSLIILIIDRRRENYNTLAKWFLIIIRYYLAYQMINYGVAKIFYLQFRPPSISRLDAPLGGMSPMGLLWTFMGYSKSYTMFTGVLEFLGGILLLTKRTALLGALVTFGVMLNVLMMNYCYDVPVKLLSTHMVFFSLILISFKGKRLFDFFIRNKSVGASSLSDVVSDELRLPKNFIKSILLIAYVSFTFFSSYNRSKMYGPLAKEKRYVGFYEVEKFDVFINQKAAINIRPEKHWKSFNYIVNYQDKHWASIKYKSEEKADWHPVELDTLNKQMKIKLSNTMDTFALDYKSDGEKLIKLSGVFADDSITAVLRKKNPEDYPLMSRKFSWVQERPYNR